MNFSEITSTRIFRYGFAVGGIFVLTFFLGIFQDQINSTTVALAFLLFVLIAATFFGRNPALLASFVGMLCFNFFFLHPLRTWAIADAQNLVAWGAFTITAVVAGELSAYARRRADEAEAQKIEIERLYHELQNAFEKASHAEALKQSEKLKSSLLDAVTHDLRTPLTSIKAAVTTLLDDQKGEILDDAGRLEFLEIINEENDRLNEFIEGMVGIAKIEAKSLHRRKNWSEIEEIVGNAVNRARIRLASHRVSIRHDQDLPAIFADAVSVSEVVYTLLDNAAKYSPEDSEIEITARQISTNFVEIAIQDQGKGIPNDLREKVFDKFFRRAENEIHTTESGPGLGLAIAHGIIESQNGKIRIEDGSENFVTKFVIQIPISEQAEKN